MGVISECVMWEGVEGGRRLWRIEDRGVEREDVRKRVKGWFTLKR